MRVSPRPLIALLLTLIFCACSRNAGERLPGLWSNGEKGQVLDITPNGLYAEVWLESEARLSAWKTDDDELTLLPLCTALAPEPRTLPFAFDDNGLEFPDRNGRYTRYIQEPRQPATDPRLVGLWFRETEARKTELIEFTPWNTVMWNRWVGAAGNETLITGWASLSRAEEGGLLFSGVEGGTLLSWNQGVQTQASASKVTLTFPAEIGEKTYLRAEPSEAEKASKAPTR